MGFTIQAATIYVPIAFSVIALNAGQKTYLIKKQQNSLASLISELLDDCSLWLVFPINALMGSPASPVLLLSLVVIGAFASNTISTRLISHFAIAKAVLLSVCLIYALFYGCEFTRSIRVIAPLIASFILITAAGYWYYVRQVQVLHYKLAENELQKQLNEKSSELANEHRLRERLIRHVGHDLRQPVNALNYAVFNMFYMNKDPQINEQLEVAKQSVEAANYLIEEITHIAVYKNSESIKPTLETVSCSEILLELAREYSLPAAQANCQLRVVNSSLNTRTDKQIAKRILRNLISNSIRYASGSNILLGVRRSDDMLSFEVIDQGPGIQEQYLKSIFTEFSQGGHSQCDKGFGLGLAISKKLALALNGDVRVRSKFGNGTHCSLILPLAKV